ncbi:MAG: ABC transporter ATP-binding protein [Candidatus Acidiferrales bacterium]
MKNEFLAQLSGATKRFDKIVALDQINLQVRPGELLAVLGPNGAGKTTAISLLLGLHQPDSGTAQLFGRSPELVETRRRVGVMMQEVTLATELRVREHVALVSSYYPNPLPLDAVIKMTGTTELASRFYGKLSGGQKRQAQFAMAVCGRPRLLFLDEPTAGLDIQARQTMWATLRDLIAQGVSIVLTTHYLEEAEALADRLAVLARGRVIASGTLSEIRGLVSRKKITCTTALSPEQLALWPGVETAIRDRDRVQITASDAEDVVRRLLAADSTLHQLEVRSAGLAEAFSELTQEAA